MEIKINGKIHKPSKPKAGIWRQIMMFHETRTDIPTVDFIDAHAEIIAIVFANENVTKELILENIDIDEIVPLYLECFEWIINQINAKFRNLPNSDTPAGVN